jgi:adenosylmethionine-8-amino-7-oxononanoate aminotransferase
MTAEEYYQNWIEEHSVEINGMASLTRNEVIEMIEGYHGQQVKSVCLADVVRHGEQLVCDNRFCKNGKVFWHDSDYDCKVCNKAN